jgi:hypothetical protein
MTVGADSESRTSEFLALVLDGGICDLRIQQGINEVLRPIKDFFVIAGIVGLRTKHRPLAVGCVDHCARPASVARDVNYIPSVVMSLIGHANRSGKFAMP